MWRMPHTTTERRQNNMRFQLRISTKRHDLPI